MSCSGFIPNHTATTTNRNQKEPKPPRTMGLNTWTLSNHHHRRQFSTLRGHVRFDRASANQPHASWPLRQDMNE